MSSRDGRWDGGPTSHCCVKQLKLALVVASKLPEVLSRYRTSLLSLSPSLCISLSLSLRLSLLRLVSLCLYLSSLLLSAFVEPARRPSDKCCRCCTGLPRVVLASCCICPSSNSWLGCVVASLFAMPRKWQRAVSYLVSWLHCCLINAAGRS